MSDLIFENTIPYVKQKWNFINYLFGGIENYDLRSQMELFDVFFFFVFRLIFIGHK